MAMAMAAAAARRLRSPFSPLGGLRLPAKGDEVRAGERGYRYIHWSTVRTPLRGLRLPAGGKGDEVGARARSCSFIQGRTIADAPRAQVTETGATSMELWKLQVEMKYYKNAAWLLFSLFGGFVLSVQTAVQEIWTLKKEVKGLKAEVTRLSEEKSQETHVHHHHCFHPSSTCTVPPIPPPVNANVEISPSPSPRDGASC